MCLHHQKGGIYPFKGNRQSAARALRCLFFLDIGERIRSLDLGRAFQLTQTRSPIRGKSARGFWLPNLKRGNNEWKRKGPATNVSNITLVLVPRAPKEWIGGMGKT